MAKYVHSVDATKVRKLIQEEIQEKVFSYGDSIVSPTSSDPEQKNIAQNHCFTLKSAEKNVEELTVEYFLQFEETEFINQVYIRLLNRPPEPEAVSHYVGRISSGQITKLDMLREVYNSEEARRLGTYNPSLSAALNTITTVERTSEIDPEDTPNPKHLTIEYFLQFNGKKFVEEAYLGILQRLPDDLGIYYMLDNLASGRQTRLMALVELYRSDEARQCGKRIPQLDALSRKYTIVHFLYRIPIIGYILKILRVIFGLPKMVTEQRSFEHRMNEVTTSLRTYSENITGLRNTLLSYFNRLDEFERRLNKMERRLNEAERSCTYVLDNIERIPDKYEDRYRYIKESFSVLSKEIDLLRNELLKTEAGVNVDNSCARHIVAGNPGKISHHMVVKAAVKSKLASLLQGER